MTLQLSLIEEPPDNPLATEVWLFALRIGFDTERFKKFVVAGFQIERYDRENFLRASDGYLLPLMHRLMLLESSIWHFPLADERKFWNLTHDLKVPHPRAFALTQHWSYDGSCHWPGAVEELLTIHVDGWMGESPQAA